MYILQTMTYQSSSSKSGFLATWRVARNPLLQTLYTKALTKHKQSLWYHASCSLKEMYRNSEQKMLYTCVLLLKDQDVHLCQLAED